MWFQGNHPFSPCQQAQRERPSTPPHLHLPGAFPPSSSDLIDRSKWTHTTHSHTCDPRAGEWKQTRRSQMNARGGNSRTFSSQTYSFQRPFHSLHIPLAVSHPRPQLLLISWVTLHSRWASLLGGTTVDVFRDWGSGGVGGAAAGAGPGGGGGGVGCLVIVNIFVPPSPLPPPSPLSAPVLCCVTFLRDPRWTASAPRPLHCLFFLFFFLF